MPDNRLLAIITALVYFGGSSGVLAVYSIDQLRDIEQFVTAKNCGGLRGYLLDNPEIIEGADELAEELRKFAFGVDTGLIQCLAVKSSPPVATPTIASTASLDLQY